MTRAVGRSSVSQRAALAQLAAQTVLDSHEVAALESVMCVAEPDGRYEVTLGLVARPVSLHRLSKNLRERVRRAAEARGLGDELGAVNVIVTDVVSVEEEEEGR